MSLDTRTGPDVSEENVYQFVKALAENTEGLMKVSKGFSGMHEGGLDFQVDVINSIPEVPVHPGTAKYLKEQGRWNDKWIIGTLK